MKITENTANTIANIFSVIMCIAALLLALMLLTACETPQVTTNKPTIARVTYYNRHEDKYGNHIAASPYRRAVVGQTVAAEECCYPFGTRICFPSLDGVIGRGVFVVEDRGRAVNSRKASKGTCPVFDIYAGTRSRMREWARKIPPYLPFYEL